LLGLIGVGRLWQREPVYVLWLGIALAFLLVWPTKWPQYILILTAPLSLSAAEGVQTLVVGPAKDWWQSRSRPQPAVVEKSFSRRETLRSLPWLLPGLIGLGVLILFPLFYQLAMSLTDFNGASIRDGINGGVWREVWRGLTGQVQAVAWDPFSNVRYIAKQVHFAGGHLLGQMFSGAGSDLLVFNLIWMVLSVSLQAALGISLAVLLNRRGVRLAGLWRTIFILPWAIPEFIGALIWLRTLQPDTGWLGMALPRGADNYFSQNAGPGWTLFTLLVASTWYGFPFIMLVAAASLKLIPAEVYDAAALDGAHGWTLFHKITWPLLMPLVVPALILRSIFAFNQFYLFYVMNTNFPMVSLAAVSYYFFTSGNQYAVSAAINIFTVAVLIGLLIWFNRWSKAAQGVTYA
ncbi:MAG: carbohydrate ABC transporter permease, partial [Bacteroidota bacterium]